MRRWFAAPPSAKPTFGVPDVTTIKMQWLLGFKAPDFIFDLMKLQKVWSNDAAKLVMAERLRTRQLVNSRFDFSSENVLQQHALQVNYRKVSPGATIGTIRGLPSPPKRACRRPG